MSSKLESDVCYHVYGWCYLVKATEIIVGLAESNGSLLPGGWLKVTCRLTACTSGSARGPVLSNEYGKTLPLTTDVTATIFSCLSQIQNGTGITFLMPAYPGCTERQAIKQGFIKLTNCRWKNDI